MLCLLPARPPVPPPVPHLHPFPDMGNCQLPTPTPILLSHVETASGTSGKLINSYRGNAAYTSYLHPNCAVIDLKWGKIHWCCCFGFSCCMFSPQCSPKLVSLPQLLWFPCCRSWQGASSFWMSIFIGLSSSRRDCSRFLSPSLSFFVQLQQAILRRRRSYVHIGCTKLGLTITT